ncbi:MAG: 50S ribosomal protein L25 [Halobacteriovoraceae bacterium]|nr:50S ribosomal protein L25 [Halobacteriovoraceae bacterium]|tara:strand:- start:38012 stop:38641 length:630 start_codon:yes stop_codon:yes gene_type:complete
MATTVLEAKKRVPNLSRGELMKERKNGKIPAVFFGQGIDSVPLFVDLTDFNRTFDANGKIFEIKIGNQKKLVNTKTIQWDPQRKHIWHIDFYALKKGVETTVKVPVTLVGEAAGQKEGGSVQQRQDVLEVTGTPMNIPEEIKVDVSKLGIGDSIHVSDLNISSDLTMEADGELTVATVVPPQKAEESEPEEPVALNAETVTTETETKAE